MVTGPRQAGRQLWEEWPCSGLFAVQMGTSQEHGDLGCQRTPTSGSRGCALLWALPAVEQPVCPSGALNSGAELGRAGAGSELAAPPGAWGLATVLLRLPPEPSSAQHDWEAAGAGSGGLPSCLHPLQGLLTTCQAPEPPSASMEALTF